MDNSSTGAEEDGTNNSCPHAPVVLLPGVAQRLSSAYKTGSRSLTKEANWQSSAPPLLVLRAGVLPSPNYLEAPLHASSRAEGEAAAAAAAE